MLKKINGLLKDSHKKIMTVVYKAGPRVSSEHSYPPPYSKKEPSSISARLKVCISDLRHHQKSSSKRKEVRLALLHMMKALKYIKAIKKSGL